MPALASSTLGTVAWLDLSTPDVAGAMEFYASLFGWEMDRYETDLGVYYGARIGSSSVAGMMQRGPEVPPFVPAMWTVYIRVESVDTTVARAQLIDGRVIEPPFDLQGGTRIAILADPTGAAFAVSAGEGLDMLHDAPGAFAGCEILTRDVDSARHFYTDMFGWTADVNLDTGYITFRVDGREVSGLMAMPPGIPSDAPSHWLPYFGVADCVEACAGIAAAGGRVAAEPRLFQVGDAGIRMAVGEDPQGAVFGMIEHVG